MAVPVVVGGKDSRPQSRNPGAYPPSTHQPHGPGKMVQGRYPAFCRKYRALKGCAGPSGLSSSLVDFRHPGVNHKARKSLLFQHTNRRQRSYVIYQ